MEKDGSDVGHQMFLIFPWGPDRTERSRYSENDLLTRRARLTSVKRPDIVARVLQHRRAHHARDLLRTPSRLLLRIAIFWLDVEAYQARAVSSKSELRRQVDAVGPVVGTCRIVGHGGGRYWRCEGL